MWIPSLRQLAPLFTSFYHRKCSAYYPSGFLHEPDVLNTIPPTLIPPGIQTCLSYKVQSKKKQLGGCVIMDDRDPAAKSDRPARSTAPRVRLSCEACRQRKVRCDKLSPCTSCQRLGFVCVPVERARLPRGRTRKAPEKAGSSDKELADRVAKLEQLLRRVAAERDETAPAPAQAEQQPATDLGPEQTFDLNTRDAEAWRDQNAEPEAQSAITPTNPQQRSRFTASYMGSSFWEDIMQQVSILASYP